MIDIDKIKAFPFAAILIFILTLFSGVMFIFLYDKATFYELDMIVLLILSCVNIAPIIVLNAIVFILSVNERSSESWTDSEVLLQLSGSLLFGSIFTMPVIALPNLLRLLIPIGFSLGIVFVIVLEILAIILIKQFSK